MPQSLGQPGAPGVIAVHHGLGRQEGVGLGAGVGLAQQRWGEELGLGLEIGLHRPVVIEVVLGEVGEHGAGEAATGAALLIEAMGAHLHGPDPGAGRHRLGQLGLEPIGEGRGVAGGLAMAGPAVDQGAEQGHGAAAGARQVLNQAGGGGLAVGAGNPDQGQVLAGLLPEGRRQLAGPGGHRIGNHNHRIARDRGFGRRRRWTDHRRRGTGGQGLGPEPAAIHGPARQADKQASRRNSARITAHVAHLRIGQAWGHGHAGLTEKRMQQGMRQRAHRGAGALDGPSSKPPAPARLFAATSPPAPTPPAVVTPAAAQPSCHPACGSPARAR